MSALVVVGILWCSSVGVGVMPEPTPAVVAPVLLKRVEPKLPKGAQAIPITLEARISEQGDVDSVRVLQSDNPDLNPYYVAALKQYRYKPGTVNGKPVAVVLNVTVLVKYQ